MAGGEFGHTMGKDGKSKTQHGSMDVYVLKTPRDTNNSGGPILEAVKSKFSPKDLGSIEIASKDIGSTGAPTSIPNRLSLDKEVGTVCVGPQKRLATERSPENVEEFNKKSRSNISPINNSSSSILSPSVASPVNLLKPATLQFTPKIKTDILSLKMAFSQWPSAAAPEINKSNSGTLQPDGMNQNTEFIQKSDLNELENCIVNRVVAARGPLHSM